MSTSAILKPPARSTALVAAVGGILVIVLLGQRLSGADGYPTDPIGTLALAGAAVVAQMTGAKLAASAPSAARLATALVVALLGYLALCVAAVGLSSAVVVAVWSVAWIPCLAIGQVLASSAVRPRGAGPRIHTVVFATSAVAMVAGAVLWQPIDPFAGVAPLAPEAWPSRFTALGGVATLVGFGGLLLLPVTLSRAAAGSRDRARMRLGVAAAGTTAAPLVITFCVALAIAADPGGVDPSAGSVAFQVAVASGAAAGAMCASLASGDLDRRRVSVVTRAACLAAAALAVAAAATLVVAAGWGATPTALLVAALAVGAVTVAWRGGDRLGAVLSRSRVEGADDPPPTSIPSAPASALPSAPRLTSREREVLAHLADGASNAGIAAQLVVSERTVDAHLRAIFTKLGLPPDPGANRRVVAAKLWLESRTPAE